MNNARTWDEFQNKKAYWFSAQFDREIDLYLKSQNLSEMKT